MTTKTRFPIPAPFIRAMRILIDRLEHGDLTLDQFNDFSSVTFTALDDQTDLRNTQTHYKFELFVSKKGSK